jgi:hypothetical protein
VLLGFRQVVHGQPDVAVGVHEAGQQVAAVDDGFRAGDLGQPDPAVDDPQVAELTFREHHAAQVQCGHAATSSSGT